MNDFGSILKAMMSERKVTLTELAKAMSLPSRSIQEWILNNRFPRDPQIIKGLAEYFGCSVHHLLYGSEDPHAHNFQNFLEKTTIHTGKYEITIRSVKSSQD